MGRRGMGLAAAGFLAACGPVVAQDRPFDGGGWRGGGRNGLTTEDRAAFADARIAALRAGLRLTPEQEKLWPPVEAAMRGLAQQRLAARQARRERFANWRETGKAADLPDALRFMADRQSASADALRRLADTAQPLYASLDDPQKRRLAILTRGLRPGGWGMNRGRGHPERRGSLPDGSDPFGAPRRG